MSGAEDAGFGAASHSYFIPMVDMLAGVVFILVILLASVTLVSREDFSTAQAAQTEISKIKRQLDAARALDRAVLQPRRDAEAAMRLLLTRLRDGLARRGLASSIDPEQGRLEIDADGVFVGDSLAVSASGEATAGLLAQALAPELTCLAPSSTGDAPDCSDYRSARLDRAIVAVEDESANAVRSGTRALRLLGEIVGADPELLGLRAADGDQLIGYRGFAQDAKAGGGKLILAFQMNVPALPSPTAGP